MKPPEAPRRAGRGYTGSPQRVVVASKPARSKRRSASCGKRVVATTVAPARGA